MGGHAFSNISRIKKKEIPAILKYVSKFSNISIEKFELLGSAGIKETSGDIDIALDNSKYNILKNLAHLTKKLGKENVRFLRGMNVISLKVPININKFGQVDFMFVSDIPWAKFYYVTSRDSKYKAAVRAILLSSAAAIIEESGIDYFEYDENNELIIRAGRTIDIKGFRRIFKYRPKRKRGEGHVLTFESININEFKNIFPHIKISENDIRIADPEIVLEIIFKNKISKTEAETTEQVIDLIKNNFNKKDQDKIFMIAGSRAESLIGKTALPPELINNLKD